MIATSPLTRIDPAHSFLWPVGSSRPGPGNRILVVDHNEQKLSTLTGYLDDTYELFVAKNEYAVLKTIEKNQIQLIITSDELHNGDGSLLCSKLKSSPHHSHIPVILLISNDSMLSRLKCLESGADACIERPFSRVYIQAQIKNLIANRMKIRDYYTHSLFAYLDTSAGSKTDRQFLTQLNSTIAEHLSDAGFDIDTLAKSLNMSRPTLYRKIRTVSDLSPNELINVARLNKAAELISTTDRKIFEIARMVGFHSRSNFGKAFFSQFRVTPTVYQKLKKVSA
jgi:AraC-like DNA-binding protein/CheY-like chemotaxis protein